MGKDSYLFKFGSKRVMNDKSRMSLLARLCSTFPELNELRILKIRAEKICGESQDQFDAIQNINDFIVNIPPGKEYDDFRAFGRTLNNWMPEVLNYFKYGKQYTNAATEGVNALIKQLNGVGRGYSFEILRAKALYWSEAHRKSALKARSKPSSGVYKPGSNISMEWADPKSFRERIGFKLEYIAGDMSDIQTLLVHFDDIF